MARIKTVQDLKDLKFEKVDELEELIAKGQDREYSEAEKDRIYRFEQEIKELDEQIKTASAEEKRLMNKARAAFAAEAGGYFEEEEPENEMKYFDFQIKKVAPVDRARPVADFVLRNYDVDDRMKKANVYGVLAGLCGRKYPAGSAVDYALGQTRKSLTSSALLNPFLSAQLIDGALPKSRLMQAGMKVFSMVEGTHKFARVATYPTLEWKAELASTTERTIAFDNVTFDAKTLRGWVTVGGETLMDALNVEQALRRVFSQSLANGWDTAGLFGAGGSDEPLGVANYVGIPTLPWNDTLDNYDAFIGAQKLVHDEDGPDLTASIMSPDAYSQLGRMKGTAEFQPVNPPFVLKDHKFLQTSKSVQTTGSGTQSEIVMGGFENLNLGVRLEAEIIITPVAAATYSYNMLAVFRGDIQPNRVEDFALITGVDAAPALT